MSKILEVEEGQKEDQDQGELAVPRNNILLQRLPEPKHVQLPNGRLFYARYQKVDRQMLNPTHVKIARTYVRKTGPKM